MFFKNLTIFPLPSDWHISPSELEEKLRAHPLLPCNDASLQSRGWVSPAPEAGIVFNAGRQFLIALGTESRLLPSPVISKEVDARAKALEQQQGFAPGRKQLRDLKDRVVDELRPKAFLRDKVVRAWIDLEAHRIVVDASTFKIAEDLISVLRNDLGSFPATSLSVKQNASGVMQGWLLEGGVPGGAFQLERDCELLGQGQEAVRYVSHALDTAEIRAQIGQGKTCNRVGLVWRDRLNLMLTAALQIKRVAFEAIKEEPADGKPAERQADLEATFTLMTGELSQLITELVTLFGGLAEEEQAATDQVLAQAA